MRPGRLKITQLCELGGFEAFLEVGADTVGAVLFDEQFARVVLGVQVEEAGGGVEGAGSQGSAQSQTVSGPLPK